MIKKIIVIDQATNTQKEVLVGQISDEIASRLKINDSGNLEIASEGVNAKNESQKVNIVSVGDIQVKPGNDAVLQLDNENDTVNPLEYAVKFCNGVYSKSSRVIRAKINVAELILDTQNANTEYDKTEFQVKFRCDKQDNPVYAKLKARAFDFRCLGHGGIALQIAGKDSSGKENKIKFESDRANELGSETPLYNAEGGKGLEFGTFNNEHTSLFTGDYRFKGDAYVYGVTRQTPELVDGKYDYPTQADDFKDIVSEGNRATWNEIISIARAYSDGTLSIGSGSGEGGDSVDHSVFATKVFAESIEETANAALAKANAANDPSALLAKGAFTKTGSNNLKLSSAICDIAEVHHTDEVSGETVIDTPAYSAALNLESNGNIKIAPKGDLEVSSPMFSVAPSKGEISLDAEKINLSNGSDIVVLEGLNGINLGITPSIFSVGTKVSTKGKLENASLAIKLAYLNNNSNTVYVLNGKVHIPYNLQDFYKAGSTEETPVYYDPAIDTVKTAAYKDVNATVPIDVPTDGYYYIKSKSDNNIWVVECEEKSGVVSFKKVNDDPAKATNHGILNTISGFENTVIEPIDYIAPSTAKAIAPNSIEAYVSVELSALLGLVSRVSELESTVAGFEARLAALENPSIVSATASDAIEAGE